MALSLEEMVQIRDSVYQQPERLYNASDTVQGTHVPINTYTIVHTDGTKAGVQHFRSQGCMVKMRTLSSQTDQECIKQLLTFPAAMVYHIDNSGARLAGLKTKSKMLEFLNFLINGSIHRNMFLVKDPELVYSHGLMVRLDKHPDSVLRAATVCRSMHENPNFYYGWANRGDIPEDLAWVLGGIWTTFGDPTGHDQEHDPIGIGKRLNPRHFQRLISTLIDVYPDNDLQEIPAEQWYSYRRSYSPGFSGRFLEEHRFPRGSFKLDVHNLTNGKPTASDLQHVYNQYKLGELYAK